MEISNYQLGIIFAIGSTPEGRMIFKTQNIEEALSTSSLTGGDDEKTIKDWISDGDREHFIKEYCPDVNLE
jgi:hypothetical protein